MRGAVFAGTLPGRQEARTEALAPAVLSHPLFAGLRGDLGLGAAQTRRLMLLEPDPGRKAEIALAFASGAPALITRQHGLGRVALLTTSIDRDWTDLPLRPGFVPLVERTIRWLGGGRGGEGGTQLFVGEPRSLSSDVPLAVLGPTGAEVRLTPAADGTVSFEDTWVPGHYRIHDAGETASPPRQVFAVGVDPAESDTRRAASSPTATGPMAQAADLTVPAWRTLVLVLFGLLAAETLLRARREPWARLLRWRGRPDAARGADARPTVARHRRRAGAGRRTRA
jgi:hypothetical protein